MDSGDSKNGGLADAQPTTLVRQAGSRYSKFTNSFLTLLMTKCLNHSDEIPQIYRLYFMVLHAASIFQRFSVQEWLKAHSGSSLHLALKALVSLLSQGISIVIDDNNESSKLRASIIAAVQENVPSVRIEGVEFRPVAGQAQTLVSVQWASASNYESLDKSIKTNQHLAESVVDLEKVEEIDLKHPPTPKLAKRELIPLDGLKYTEGFKLIQYLQQPLFTFSSQPWTNPGLFIEAQCIFDFSLAKGKSYEFDLKLRHRFASTCMEWLKSRPAGRIIIVIDELSTMPSFIEAELDSPETQIIMLEDCRSKILNVLKKSGYENGPLYYYQLLYGSHPREQTSQSKLDAVSWIQARHHLSLGSSLWVGPTDSSSSGPVSPFGIPFISEFDFFSESGWNINSKLRKFSINKFDTECPAFLKSIQQLPDGVAPTTDEDVLPMTYLMSNDQLKSRSNSTQPQLFEETLEYGIVHGLLMFPQPPLQDSSISIDLTKSESSHIVLDTDSDGSPC